MGLSTPRGSAIQLRNIGSLAGVTLEAKAIIGNRELTIENVTAQSDRTLSSPVPSDERAGGDIQSAFVRVIGGTPKRGQTYGILSIRGGQELCRGYMSTLGGINLGTFEDSTAGRGHLALQSDETLNDADKTFTVPTNTRWWIHQARWEYTASATAGTREMELQIRDTDDDLIGAWEYGTLSANQSIFSEAGWSYRRSLSTAGDGAIIVGDDTSGAPSATTSYPLANVYLPEGFDIRFVDTGAADLTGDDMIIQMLVEEWFEV